MSLRKTPLPLAFVGTAQPCPVFVRLWVGGGVIGVEVEGEGYGESER